MNIFEKFPKGPETIFDTHNKKFLENLREGVYRYIVSLDSDCHTTARRTELENRSTWDDMKNILLQHFPDMNDIQMEHIRQAVLEKIQEEHGKE